MLPNFPKSRKLMDEIWNQAAFKGLNNGDPIVSQLKTRPQREGIESHYQDLSGQKREIDYQKVSSAIRLTPEDAKGLPVTEFLKIPEDAGRDMAQQMARHLFSKITEITEETGNVIDAKGEPYQFKHFLQALEGFPLEFDSNGAPHLPTAVLGAKAYEEHQKTAPDWGKNPEEQNRFQQILAQKWEEFREREISRRLVD